MKDICVHCGVLGTSDYLFGEKELREKSLTGGYKCLPICKGCLEKGMKIVKHGGKGCQAGERGENERRELR